jgi:enoyl-CoA hydratase
MTEKILSRLEGGVATIIINNPERHNAVSLDMWTRMDEFLREFEANHDVRALVLTGAGGKAFASGADISKFEKERSTVEAVAHYNATTAATSARLVRFPKPTIAMIRGYCIGGGLAIALCCDMRICGASSRFGVPAAKLGLGYAYEGIRRLVDLVGPAFAKEIFYTARQFDADEARVMGLVNRVVADEAVEATVADYAARIAENAPLTIAAVKRIVAEALKDPADRDLAAVDAMVKACFASEDYTEGRRAFMEKRKPRFTGR